MSASSDGRIERRFARLKNEGRAGLITFTMMGDPDIETSFDILKGLPAAGADLIEIGSPFTDPMADGPVIQVAGQRALKAGISLKKTLELVRRFRALDQDTPLVLMGYYNPIYVYGVPRFIKDALEAGLDGLIVVDLPPKKMRSFACRRSRRACASSVSPRRRPMIGACPPCSRTRQASSTTFQLPASLAPRARPSRRSATRSHA